MASNFTGKDGAYQTYPRLHCSSPHFTPLYYDDHRMSEPYHPDFNVNPVVKNTDDSIVGHKYFNFDKLNGGEKVEMVLDRIAAGAFTDLIGFIFDREREGSDPISCILQDFGNNHLLGKIGTD